MKFDETFKEKLCLDGSLPVDNFKKWFGNSVTVDSDGNPIVFYHGTGNVQGILDKGFSYEFVGSGVDQFGPGWYFTNVLNTASGYAQRRLTPDLPKLVGESSPGVLDVLLALQNPICTKDDENWHEQLPDLTLAQARKIILQAPDLRDEYGPLSNWGSVSYEGFDRVFRKAVEAYQGLAHFSLLNDFFRGHEEKFLKALHQVTGLDGIFHRFDSGEIHAVAWFPEQMKSASLNNGLFDGACSDITDRSSPLALAHKAKAFVDGELSMSSKRVRKANSISL